jgi:hypothetical protein
VTCRSSVCQAAWEYSFDQAAQDGFSGDLLCVDAGHRGSVIEFSGGTGPAQATVARSMMRRSWPSYAWVC